MISRNLKAFLDMIAHSEIGENLLSKTDKGYNVMFGGKTFIGYADHPRVKHTYLVNGSNVTSTAAGRYQILAGNYDFYKRQLGLHDFSPASQDAIAVQLIRECKAIPDIEAGNFAGAVHKCAHIWASLPGAGYNQHENKMGDLQAAYVTAGGLMDGAVNVV